MLFRSLSASKEHDGDRREDRLRSWEFLRPLDGHLFSCFSFLSLSDGTHGTGGDLGTASKTDGRHSMRCVAGIAGHFQADRSFQPCRLAFLFLPGGLFWLVGHGSAFFTLSSTFEIETACRRCGIRSTSV